MGDFLRAIHVNNQYLLVETHCANSMRKYLCVRYWKFSKRPLALTHATCALDSAGFSVTVNARRISVELARGHHFRDRIAARISAREECIHGRRLITATQRHAGA